MLHEFLKTFSSLEFRRSSVSLKMTLGKSFHEAYLEVESALDGIASAKTYKINIISGMDNKKLCCNV